MSKELKARIRTLKSTHKITSAMKVVSATTFNRLKHQVNHMFDFVNSLMTLNSYVKPPLQDNNRHLLIVIGGDRGLCGGYNNNIRKIAGQYFRENPETDAGYIGDKMALKGLPHIFSYPSQSMRHWETALELLGPLWFDYTHVDILYTQFHHLYDQRVVIENIVSSKPEAPLRIEGDILSETSVDLSGFVYTAHVIKALVHAQLCEYSSRMLSMDTATQNGEKMISSLQLTVNKLRQSMITKELSETTSGSIARR